MTSKGAIVVLAVLAILVVGSLFMSTSMGKKAVGFVAEARSSGMMQNMLSPQDSLGCINGGCRMPSSGMSLFG